MRYYDIDIYKLNSGTHSFQFDLNEQFFEAFDLGLFKKGKGTVEVTLDKSDAMITATYRLNGHVELTCDRSLELFEHPFDVEYKMLYKFGEEEQELDDDITIITNKTQSINVAHPVYDYIGLTIPIKKLHPDYREADENEDEEEGKLIYTSQSSPTEEVSNEEEDSETSDTDPRWNALKKLKR